MLNQYQELINPVEAFVTDMLEANPEHRIFNRDMRTQFANWCHREGHSGISHMTSRQLSDKIKDVLQQREIPYIAGKSGGNRLLKGIAFKQKIKSPLQMDAEPQEISIDELD
ncbi:UNVERIFIED_CONTAM: phage/plasmid-associated DNA primase [Paenibacillus sp. PvR008]